MHPQRQVPAAEITPALDKLHARLMAGNLDGALVTQIHDFLDIDPDLVNRVYPPFAHTHPAVSFTEPCHDRDINAARNIRTEGHKVAAGRAETSKNACGG